MHRDAIPFDASRGQIDLDWPDREDLTAVARSNRAPHRDPQTCKQFADAERLGEIVVGAGVERSDLVSLVRARRQNDDRHLGPFAQAFHYFYAADVRQPEV